MRRILIENDEFFINSLKKEFKFDIIESINDATEIKVFCDSLAFVVEDDDTLIINCNLKNNLNKRSESLGIEILKRLRLLGKFNYCILYSFMTIEQIAKLSPLNSIILSKGVKFIQLPLEKFMFAEIMIKNEFAEKENLLPFFRSEIDLPRIRHEMANVWGAKRINWLLDIKTAIINNNFLYDVLEFTTPITKHKELDKNVLETFMMSFQNDGIKVFYYDDMSTYWQPALEKMFGETNLVCFNPQTTTSESLIDEIRKQKPGCLLLDLRLNNEKELKDVLDYSGGKLLIELKEKFSSLPIIIFTASNKAETIRQLLAAGAEYVWSKEGVDDGINDIQTLNNTLNLINVVSKCITKFKNENYEMILDAECKLSKIVIEKFPSEIIGLENVKTIIIDTNYLIDSIKGNYLSVFYQFLVNNKKLDENKRKDVIIHSDVLNEIFIISKQDETFVSNDPQKDKNNPYRVPVCRFLIKKLIEWKFDNMFSEKFKEGRDDIVNKIQECELTVLSNLNYIEKIEIQRKSFLKSIFDYLEKRDSLKIEEINKQIDEINEKLKLNNKKIGMIPDISRLKLHADTMFKYLIPNRLNYGGVCFVSNDRNCAYEIGNIFNGMKLINEMKCEYSKENEPLKESYKEATIEVKRGNITYSNIYKHLFTPEFNKLITPVALRIKKVNKL